MSSPHSTIPTSSSVTVSSVIDAPLSQVWHLIKLEDFSKWWSIVEKSEMVKGTTDDTDVVRWSFKDGSSWEVKQEAHSSIDYFITYSAITANPSMSYSSVVSTIRLWRVTSGQHANSTYIEWSAQFSNDADAGVIEDARFKRQEALADLAKSVSK